MSLLLNIDTSVSGASACISHDQDIIDAVILKNQENGLHQRILEMMAGATLKMQELQAVAVTIGPGSYTGLRVGLATAKGLCFALGLPLITIGTLEMMANTLRDRGTTFICPMIDARRMEVFTAVYDQQLREIIPPRALVIDNTSFHHLLEKDSTIFAGNGSTKLKGLLNNANAVFVAEEFNALNMPVIAAQYYQQQRFADLAYSEPLYLKEFYLPERHTS